MLSYKSEKFVVKKFSCRVIRKSLLLITLVCLTPYSLAAEKKHVHQHPQAQTMQTSPTVHAVIQKTTDNDGKKTVFFKLMDATNNAIALNDLKEVHTQKIHVLVIDDSLSDYHHLHPKPTQEPGVYQFTWEPSKKQYAYRMWVDIVPLKTNTQEYVIAELLPPKTYSKPKINTQPSLESTVDGYHFQLSFDKMPLVIGQPAMGEIKVTDAQGKPVRNLEPVMGAFAHIVGFNIDFKTVVHIHPMGKEPNKNTERGGPELQFHLEPEKIGFTKLFAQVKINGKELFAPFSIVVMKAKA